MDNQLRKVRKLRNTVVQPTQRCNQPSDATNQANLNVQDFFFSNRITPNVVDELLQHCQISASTAHWTIWDLVAQLVAPLGWLRSWWLHSFAVAQFWAVGCAVGCAVAQLRSLGSCFWPKCQFLYKSRQASILGLQPKALCTSTPTTLPSWVLARKKRL
jgi:hypothetical protein